MRQAFGGITPNDVSSVLALLERGYPEKWVDLTRHMLKTDGHLDDRYERMRFAVAGAPMRVTAGPHRDEALAKEGAELCRLALGQIDDLEANMMDMLEAEGIGWSMHELVWEWRDAGFGTAYLPSLEPYDARRFRFVEHHRPILYDGGRANLELEPAKWVVHYARSRSGYPIENGKLLGCVWPWLLKNWGWKFWSAASERFGVPMLLGKVPVGTHQNVIRDLQERLQKVSALHAAVLKSTTTVEVIKPEAQASSDVFSKQIEMLNDEISKALGDTSADTKAYGDAENAREQRVERAELYGKNLCSTIRRQILGPFLSFNRHLTRGLLAPTPKVAVRPGLERRPIPQSLIDQGGVWVDELRESAGLEPWGGEEGRRKTGPTSVSMPSGQPAQPAQPAQPNQPRQPVQPNQPAAP